MSICSVTRLSTCSLLNCSDQLLLTDGKVLLVRALGGSVTFIYNAGVLDALIAALFKAAERVGTPLGLSFHSRQIDFLYRAA